MFFSPHFFKRCGVFYVYDGDGNIVRSIDISGKKEYNYEYEEGRIIRATEADIELNGEIVTSKVIANTVKYYYDTEGKMTKKVITPASGSAQTIYYETNDNNTVVKFSAGGRTVTSHSKTDSFGRKVFDELQLGTDFVSRQFVYHAGKVTEEHKTNAKVKSSATTQLVSQIILSDGRTLSYEYDAEERITSITEKYTVDEVETTDTTSYTYDALGQLLTETNVVQTIDRSEEEPVVTVTSKLVNSMEYDNYGNIVEKNGKAYTYGNATWKDLLTGFDGKTIEYDAQGNPTSYLGHTLTWEKGRQLKKFDNIEYTYNANGIRTSKKVNGVLHTYTLDGTKILRETWDGNNLIPLYDNEDSVCGILYNNVPYYFIKNLQGDIIAIVGKDAKTVARYSYDAWGAVTSAFTDTDFTKGVDIATVNPFRYRGYYYDEEIELYYLQSRYYDAGVGRFINADNIEALRYVSSSINTNLFTYCLNYPVNFSDINGNIPAQIVAQIILGIMFGFAVQLLSDCIDYLFKRCLLGNQNATIEPHIADYAISMLTWGFSFLLPNTVVWNAIAIFVPIAIKHVWRWATGKFDWHVLASDLIVGVISFVIRSILKGIQKRKMTQLTKHLRKSKNVKARVSAKKNLKKTFKILGARIDFAFSITSTFLAPIIVAIIKHNER